MAIVTFNNTNPSVCNLTVTLNANPAQPITVNGVTFPFNFNPETYGFGPNETDGLYTFNCADCRYDHIVEGGNITTTTTSTSSTTSTTTETPTTSSTTTVEETTSTTTEDPIVDVELRWLINEGGIDTLQLIDDGNVYSPLRTESFTYNNSSLGTLFRTVQVGALNGFEFTGLSGELTYKINGDPIVSGGSNVQHNISGFSANYSPSNEVWSLNLAITAQPPYGELVDGEVFTLEIFGDAESTTTTTEFTLPEFFCSNALPVIETGQVDQEVVLSQPLSEGILQGIEPQYYVEGDQTYTVEVKIPAGYQDVGQSIFCDVNGVGFTTTTSSTTLQTLLCEDVDIVIGGGLEGTPVIDTITTNIGTVDSVIPENFVEGTNNYQVNINLPEGYNNNTLECTVSGVGTTTTTITTLPTLECEDIVLSIPNGDVGDTITASATLDGVNLTIQQIEHSGSVVTEYMAGFVQYDVIIVVPDGFNNPQPTLSCSDIAFGVTPTTTSTTTEEITTTTTEEITTTTTLPRMSCGNVTVNFNGNAVDGGQIMYNEFTVSINGYSGGDITITDIQPVNYDVDESIYQVTFTIPQGYQNAGGPFTCNVEITVAPTTTSSTTEEITSTTTEEITSTTTEEITTTSTEAVVYGTYKITPCCDNTDPTATVHQYVELPNTYTVSDVLSINNVCYTITEVSTGPNPLTPTSIVDYESSNDCVQDDNNFGCVYTYEACAETLHGHGNLMVNPQKINIIDNQIYGETVEDKEYKFVFTNSGGQTFLTTDCYNHIDYDSTVDVVDAISNGDTSCSDNSKCGYFNMYIEHCDTGKSSTVQISMLAANNLGLVNGDVISSPALVAVASAYGGGTGTCYTVGGKTNTVNSSQNTEQTGTDWSLTTKKTTEVDSCFDTGCGCKKNFTVTNTSNDTFILRYKTCSGDEFFEPVMGPFESITFNDDDCVNMNTIWYYSTIQDTQNGYGTYYNKIEISGLYEDCDAAERNVSTTTTEKNNPITTSTTIGDTTSTTTEEVTTSTTTENVTTSTTTENITTSTTIEPPISTTTTTEEVTSTTTEIPCLIYELSNRNREGGDTMTAYFTDCDGKPQEAIVLADSEGTICALQGSVSFPGVVTESTECDPSQTTSTTTTVNTDTTTSTTTNGSGGGSGSSSDEYDGNLTTSTTSGPKGGGNLTTSTTTSNNDGDITTSTTIDLIITDPTETSTTTMDTGDGSGNGGGQVTSTTTTNGSGGGSVGSRESVYEFERCDDNSVVRILTSQWIGLPPLSGSYFKLDVGQGEECMEYGFTTVSSDFDTLTSVSGPYDSCMSCEGIVTSTTTIQQIITSTTTEDTTTTSTTTIQQVITSTTTEEVITSTTTEEVTSTTTELPCYYYELVNRNPQGTETMIGTYYDCDGKLQDVYVLGDSEGTICALQGTVSFSGDTYEVGLCGSIPETTSTTVIEEPITTSTTEEPVLGGGSGSE